MQQDMVSDKYIFNFIHENNFTVLSYVYDENIPASALVEFSEREDFSLVFDTFRSARKYKYIRDNPRVSFVIGCSGSQSVQYEGRAHEVIGDEVKLLQETHREKLKDVEKFEENLDIAYFLVSPVWLKFTDVSVSPWIVKEINFAS